jgi:hypothetical protein
MTGSHLTRRRWASLHLAPQRDVAVLIASPRGVRFCALCGLAGPALFTAAWVVSSLRQSGHPAAEVQLSGLAAIDARDPQIMIAGFVALGAGSIVFGGALGQWLAAEAAGPLLRAADGRMRGGSARLAGAACRPPRAGGRLRAVGGLLAAGAGPWLVMAAGAAAVAAGLLRRDHMLLAGPGFAGESWHNQGHDLVSGAAYTAMIAAPIALSRRLRTEPGWAAVCPILLGLALVSGAALVLFASGVLEPWNGTVQRVAVTLPLAAEAIAAGRILAISRARSCSAHRPLGRRDPSARRG